MSEFDNTNRGVLFRNKRKELDSHPTHTGSINVEGKEYWLSAWTNQKKDGSGEKYFSLSVTEKDAAPKKTETKKGPPVDPEDDIPF